MNGFNSKQASNTAKLESIHNKVKPLHGHPYNRDLLKNLEEELTKLKEQIIADDLPNVLANYIVRILFTSILSFICL